MYVESLIEELWDGKAQPRINKRGIMVHRVGINEKTGQTIGTNALDIGRAFIGKRPEWKELASATGGQNAYTFMIGGYAEKPGQVWQCLPIDEIGWHGRRFSRGWIGVALIGDYRVRDLHPDTRRSLVHLCADLSIAFDFDPMVQIMGHGEVRGAHGGDKAPGRRGACPGDKVPMSDIRAEVRRRTARVGLKNLTESGVRL